VGGLVERYRWAAVTRIREHVIVDASPEEVWDVVADPRNLPRWNRLIRAVHDVPQDGLREGSAYRAEVGGLGVSLQVRARVEELEAPRYAQVRLSGPIEATVRTWIRPAGRRRSLLEHEVDYRLRGGSIGELIARTLRVAGAPTLLRRGIRAQKRQVEGS
jgi:ligand-binding SRPBCC domain-containing protein